MTWDHGWRSSGLQCIAVHDGHKNMVVGRFWKVKILPRPMFGFWEGLSGIRNPEVWVSKICGFPKL